MDQSHSKTLTLRESIVEESRNTIDCFMIDGKTFGDILKGLPQCNKARHGRYKTQVNLDKNLFDFSIENKRKTTTNKDESVVLEEKDNENSDDNSSQQDKDNDNEGDHDIQSPKTLSSAKGEEGENEQQNEQQEGDLEQLVSNIQEEESKQPTTYSLPSYLQSIQYLENQFVLENREEQSKKEIERKKPIAKEFTINSFDIVTLTNKDELFNNIKTNTKMKISSICCVGDELFLGAENGIVYKYNLKDNKELFVFKSKDIPSNSILWSIDSDSGKYIVTGFSNGNVNLIHNMKLKSLGLIKTISKSGIITIKMILSKKQRTTFIACDFTGMIYKVKVKMNLLLKNETIIEKIYNNSIPIYNVIFMRFSKEQIIAFSTLDFIKVIKIKPDSKELISIPREKNAKETFLYDFAFGLGQLNKEANALIQSNDNDNYKYNHNLFCYSKESYIILLSFEIYNNSINEIKQIGEYNTYSTIIKVGFISASLMYFIDEYYKMKLINTIDFNVKRVNSYNEDNIKYNIIDLKNIDTMSLNIFTDVKNRINKATYFNFILNSNQGEFLFGRNMISVLTLKSCEQCIYDLIKVQEWEKAIELVSDVLKGNNAIWDSEALGAKKDNLINDLIIKYMEYIIHLNRPFNDTSCPKEYLLIQCFDFCIEQNIFNSIIDKLMPLFIVNNQSDLLFITLQPYIFLNYFNNKNIKSDFVIELLKVYCNQKQLLSSLLFHIDIECLEIEEVYHLIQDNRIINTLVYIITNKSKRFNDDSDDYFIPITILSNMLNGLSQKLDCAISPLKYCLNDISLIDDELFYSNEYLTYKIYWYCCLVLEGEGYYTKTPLIEDMLNTFVIHIALWLTSDNILNSLLSFDPFAYFNVWSRIMSKESYVNLLKWQIMAEYKIVMKEMKVNNIKNYTSSMTFIGILEKKVNEIDDLETYKAFYDFILHLAKSKNNKLSNELLINAGKYLISYETKKPTEDAATFQEKIIAMLKEISQFSHEDLLSLLNSFKDANHFDLIKEFLSSFMSTN